MSSSSATAFGSRSPSPRTPEPPDTLEPVAIQSEDISSSWYLAMHAKPLQFPWGSDPSLYHTPPKVEDNQMLRLDDLIEQDAYDDSPSPTLASSSGCSSPPAKTVGNLDNPPCSSPIIPNFRSNNLFVPSHKGPVSVTKPIPPPASLPRKLDPSSVNQRIIYPQKESCYNLPIVFPSIPEGGTKSRVETQVRVTVDLTDPSSSPDPFKYDRVGSWKWLRLPHGTATKKRTRKQGKIDPDADDLLQLSVNVTCASPPYSRVFSCSSCQAREAKRVAKKLAARVRPARSDSDSCDGNGEKQSRKHYEDTTSIIQFNCAEILDFSTGSVILPLRITCYCRHHREKVGFNVHFTMTDSIGRLIGSGISKPIMITDDHKTTASGNNHRTAELIAGFSGITSSEWTPEGGILRAIPNHDMKAPSKRKKDSVINVGIKNRPKPYDSGGKAKKSSREGSISSLPSPSASYSSLPVTRSPTPSSIRQHLFSAETAALSQPPPLQHSAQSSETSSPDTIATPLDHGSDVFIPDVQQPQKKVPQSASQQPLTPMQGSVSPPMSVQSMMIPPQGHSMPFMLFNQAQLPQSLRLQLPIIHRLIPNTGPTYGGIEVTVLGANFHPSIQLNCIFGDTAASSTQRWSENTLVCVLPPRATPGVVAVWFEGFPKMNDQIATPPSLFTYSDESDRALMELALQVVGLKMTGKIEDAKNVAMRIVGTAGSDNSGAQGDDTNMMQLASSSVSSTRDLRPLLLIRASENDDFESLIIDFLSIMDTPLDTSAPASISTGVAISHPSPSGQTLLHLATFLGFASLVKFLVDHDIDLDARDRNGYTALHFVTLSKSTKCGRILLEACADEQVVNSLGKTPKEIAEHGFFDDLTSSSYSGSDSDQPEDEEADWGDAEEDGDVDVELRRVTLRRASYRNLRKGLGLSAPARATPRHSVDPSRAPTPLPTLDQTEMTDDVKKPDDAELDAKRTASFMEKMIQRTLAQLPAPQGIIPQLPLPHLPDLPGVPWARGALPQIPMIFPVFVPMMPGWPAFLGGETASGDSDKDHNGGDTTERAGGAIRAAQEWRATWEKWVALAIATTARQQTEDLPPPLYTPRLAETEAESPAHSSLEIPFDDRMEESSPNTSRRHIPAEIRPVGYEHTSVPEQEVSAYAYQPIPKQKQKVHKKNDRMLLLFWLPILLLSMLWTLHNGFRFALQAIKMALPGRVPLVS